MKIFLLLFLASWVFACNSWAEDTVPKETQQINKESAYKIADGFAKCAGHIYVFADINNLYPELQNTALSSKNAANAWKYGAAWILYITGTNKDFNAAVGYAESQTEQTYRSQLASFETNNEKVLEQEYKKMASEISVCHEVYGELQLEMTNQMKRFLYENPPADDVVE